MSEFDPQTLLTEQAQQAIADQFARFGVIGQEMYHQLFLNVLPAGTHPPGR
jgi:hypothetical protein